MQIAQVLSGYTLGNADLLRRAMGKKIQAEMDVQRQIFVEGAVAQSVPEKHADDIFNVSRQVRRLRLQQIPRRGLCAGRVSNSLYESQSSGRIPGRVHDLRYGQHGQAEHIPPGTGPIKDSATSAGHQCLGRDVYG